MVNTGPLVDMFIEGAPVSANRMWRRARQGHLYISPEAVAWELAVKSQIAIAGIDRKAVQAARHPLRVVCEFNRVRGDADNYLKPVLDGLKYGLQIDDRFFRPVESHVVADRSQPKGVRVLIYAAATPNPEPTPEEQPRWTPPGRIRVADLVEPETRAGLRERFAPHITLLEMFAPAAHVRVELALRYGAVVALFPPSTRGGEHADSEWGTFLPLAQARELRDALVAVLAGVEE